MSWYVEIRRTVCRYGDIEFTALPLSGNERGFRSIFAFDEAFTEILVNKTLVDSKNAVLYSDILFVDFDSDEGVQEFAHLLVDLGVSFELYSTGRRGKHFHIPIVPMTGIGLGYSHEAWVKEHTKYADFTIYSPRSIIRLPGTWHEKSPGHRKECIYKQEGDTLNIPKIDKSPKPTYSTSNYTGIRNISDFWLKVMKKQCSPGRNEGLVILGAIAAQCGISYEEGVDAAKWWALTKCDPPLIISDNEVDRQFSNGYRRVK